MGIPHTPTLKTRHTLTKHFTRSAMGCGTSRRNSWVAFDTLYRKIHSKQDTDPVPCKPAASECDRLTHQNTFLNARTLSKLLQQDVDAHRRESEWDQYLAHG